MSCYNFTTLCCNLIIKITLFLLHSRYVDRSTVGAICDERELQIPFYSFIHFLCFCFCFSSFLSSLIFSVYSPPSAFLSTFFLLSLLLHIQFTSLANKAKDLHLCSAFQTGLTIYPFALLTLYLPSYNGVHIYIEQKQFCPLSISIFNSYSTLPII